MTFGVAADRVETGYGYIRPARDPGPVFPVAEFAEKPDAAPARRYIESGEYYWNSGMFMFRASAHLAELGRHAPANLAACRGCGPRPRFPASAGAGVFPRARPTRSTMR